MNTQSISINSTSSRLGQDTRTAIVKRFDIAASLVRWSAAATVALAVMIGGIWAATNPAVTQYLSAGLWAMGFVFFAVALEVDIKRIFLPLTTGFALPVLALLGSRVAEEYSVLAVALIAGWLVFWIGRGR